LYICKQHSELAAAVTPETVAAITKHTCSLLLFLSNPGSWTWNPKQVFVLFSNNKANRRKTQFVEKADKKRILLVYSNAIVFNVMIHKS